MDPITIGALVGMGVYKTHEEQKAAGRQRKMNAELMRHSPWTGMQPNPNVQDPSMMGNVMQGAVTGMAMSQNQEQIDAYKARMAQAPAAAPALPPDPALSPSQNTTLAQMSTGDYSGWNGLGQGQNYGQYGYQQGMGPRYWAPG